MAKETTTEKGIVHSYFANIFGPIQYQELHERLAKKNILKYYLNLEIE